MIPKRGIFIGGMHRSGTSFLAKCFSVCGADLGRRCLGEVESSLGGYLEEIRKDAFNVRPLSEDPVFSLYNTFLLDENGGSWDKIPDSITWSNIKFKLPLLFGDKMEPFVVKDPRFSVLFHLYRPFFLNSPFIISVRSPMPTAISLSRRAETEGPRLDVHKALQLWQVYYSNLILYNNHYHFNMKFVHYPSMRGLKEAIEYCGLKFSQENIDEIFDPSLIHNDVDEVPKFYEYTYQQLLQLVEETQNGCRTDCGRISP